MSETSLSANPTESDQEDGTVADELTDRQIDAARLIATNPDRAKQDVAASLKISRRTIFRWLKDAQFQKKIEEFRRSTMVANDAKSVLGMLSTKEKKEVLTLLLGEKENRHLDIPEIEKLEIRITEIAENDDDPKREVTKGAIEKVELLHGRLMKNVLFDRHYEADGRLKHMPFRESLAEIIELLIIQIEFSKDDREVRDGRVELEACKLALRHLGGDGGENEQIERFEGQADIQPGNEYSDIEETEEAELIEDDDDGWEVVK